MTAVSIYVEFGHRIYTCLKRIKFMVVVFLLVKNTGTSKGNTSKFVSKDFEEIDAMIDEDVVAAIDRVLLEGITFPLKSRHSVQGQQASKLDPNLFEQLFQELRDIAFKEDLVEKFKGLLSLKRTWLKNLGVVVSFPNNIVRILRNSTI
nr:hypothetical protein MtrDRAFT_AC147481g23v2 [Medicago truncatula]